MSYRNLIHCLAVFLEEKLSLQEFELLLVQLMLIICYPTIVYHSEAAGSVFLVTFSQEKGSCH